MIRLLTYCLLLAGLSGCSGILDDLRRDSMEASVPKKGRSMASIDPIRARTVRGLSANNVRQLTPNVKRQYANLSRQAKDRYSPETQERYSVEDFVDSDYRENSLWSPQGQKNYLFTHNKQREAGDLLSIKTQRVLRREIQYQLWLTLPPEQRRRRKKKKPEPKNEKEASAQANRDREEDRDEAEREAEVSLQRTPDDEFLKAEIVENEGNGLIRILGHKRVIYKGRRRTVEIIALARDRDIDNNDMMDSDKFIDMTVRVIQ